MTETEQLLAIEALDALPAHIAILDADGVVVLLNRAWKSFRPVPAGQHPTPGCTIELSAATRLPSARRRRISSGLSAKRFEAAVRMSRLTIGAV